MLLRVVNTEGISFFEINVGKSRIRYDSEFESAIDVESTWKFLVQFQSRWMSDPSLSDIDFKNELALILNKIWDWRLFFGSFLNRIYEE